MYTPARQGLGTARNDELMLVERAQRLAPLEYQQDWRTSQRSSNFHTYRTGRTYYMTPEEKGLKLRAVNAALQRLIAPIPIQRRGQFVKLTVDQIVARRLHERFAENWTYLTNDGTASSDLCAMLG
jgi:hypothetical protein